MLNIKSVSITLAVALLCAAAFSNTIGAADETESVIKTERYISEDGSYSIQFPAQWAVVKGAMGTDVIALAPAVDPEDLFRENVNIIFTKMDFPITGEEYYTFNLNSLTQILSDFDLEESHDVTLGDVHGKQLIFTHTMGVVNAKVMQYLLLVNDHAYVLTFTADPLDFPKYRSEFEKIASTFQLEPSS